MTLTVRDDGVGLPAGFSLENATSLGFILVRSLASQLGGTVSVGSGPGASFSVSFRNADRLCGRLPVGMNTALRD
jgi:two-component sensor histidine kinase